MTVEQQEDLAQQALRAFERDLRRLWAERPGQWVAYRGDRVLGFAAQQHELYHQCFAQGWTGEEFVVFCIEPIETEIDQGIEAELGQAAQIEVGGRRSPVLNRLRLRERTGTSGDQYDDQD